MNLGSFLAALALGFVAGAIARALIPNDAFRHMHGWRSLGHPGNLGGHETWEDAGSWRHSGNTRMSCANAR